MSDPIHRDPLSAWSHLCVHGGIELGGRDEGLDRKLRQYLNPDAATLEEALYSASLEQFARAFFEAIHPYVAMFRDILEFFKIAQAQQGQQQWRLQLDDISLDLQNFQEWVEKWRRTVVSAEFVPSLDRSGIWRLWDALRKHEMIAEAVLGRERPSLPPDVDIWISAYDRGEYHPIPHSLDVEQLPAELRKTALVLLKALGRLRELHMTESKLSELRRSRECKEDPSDAFDIGTLAFTEHDRWSRTMVIALSVASTALPDPELKELSHDLEKVLSQYSLRPFQVSTTVSELESILSLPIWKKRYELYSVWIATEIVSTLKRQGHAVEIRHENGRIEFAFRETVIATVSSSSEPFRLISERRTKLKTPRGEGRKEGVQPDHGLWTNSDAPDGCRLVVEVKHYKRSSNSKFADVLDDYARALPKAQIYLVNHGPVGSVLDGVSTDFRRRCHTIEKLTPSASEARKMLKDAVCKCVGNPNPPWPTSPNSTESKSDLALDVSSSMISRLRSPDMDLFLRQLVNDERPCHLFAVDSDIIGSWPATADGFASLLRVEGSSTELTGPVSAILKNIESVVVVTDAEGASSLRALNPSVHCAASNAPNGVQILVCSCASAPQR